MCAVILLMCATIVANAECGIASWYHEGARTANGEHYRPDGLTAAHRSLPFGTRLRVVDQRTGKQVIIRVNDRGPARWTGRIIDLSRGAARKIDILRSGIARVCVTVLEHVPESH